MRRTKFPIQRQGVGQSILTQEIYSTLVSRARLAAKLGQQYGGDREIYEALGYPTSLEYSDFSTRYTRQDIAKAIIDKPVGATWRGEFAIVENDDDEDTELEKAWAELDRTLRLKNKFTRADRLAGIGKYAVLLMGLDDVQTKEQWRDPVSGTDRKLLYVRPFGEEHAEIDKWVTDPKDERYGQPLIYKMTVNHPGDNATTEEYQVHYSRVIHVPSELLEDEIEGVPRLQAVFNRLMDLEKLVGASAEMFYRGARPGYQGVIDPEFTMTQEQEDALQDTVDEFDHKLRRILMLKGIELKALAAQVSDPQNHVDVQIQMISAVTGIPKRILVGSERGELASTQDKEEWKELIQARREDYAEPVIVRPFVNWCLLYGVLPKPKEESGWSVRWQDLWAASDEDRAKLGEIRAKALKAWSESLSDAVPIETMLDKILGFSPEEVKLTLEQLEQAMLDDERGAGSDEEEE